MNHRPAAPPRLLVVDDQEDVRTLLKTALEIEGYDVGAARDARDGLRCLQDGGFALVITDYAMPGGTGIWMLHEASRQGLLHHTPALVVTAHPDVRQSGSEFPVLSKPLDLDRLFGQVRHLLGQGPTPDTPAPTPFGDDANVIELALYVSAFSLASNQARRNLREVLRGFDPGRIRLAIHDLSVDPQAGDEDRIVVTPTLVKRYPRPKIWIIGSLEDRQIVADVLDSASIDAVN